MTVWTGLGFNFIIALAGLQAIPRELLESARIDGANAWQRFWQIRLPLLRPAILVALIVRTVEKWASL